MYLTKNNASPIQGSKILCPILGSHTLIFSTKIAIRNSTLYMHEKGIPYKQSIIISLLVKNH